MRAGAPRERGESIAGVFGIGRTRDLAERRHKHLARAERGNDTDAHAPIETERLEHGLDGLAEACSVGMLKLVGRDGRRIGLVDARGGELRIAHGREVEQRPQHECEQEDDAPHLRKKALHGNPRVRHELAQSRDAVGGHFHIKGKARPTAPKNL